MPLKVITKKEIDHYSVKAQLPDDVKKAVEDMKKLLPQGLTTEFFEGVCFGLIELHIAIYTMPFLRPEVLTSLMITSSVEILKSMLPEGEAEIEDNPFAGFDEIPSTVH